MTLCPKRLAPALAAALTLVPFAAPPALAHEDTRWLVEQREALRAKREAETRTREKKQPLGAFRSGPTPADPTAGTAKSPKYRPTPDNPAAPRPRELR